jgi:hypothetical protein
MPVQPISQSLSRQTVAGGGAAVSLAAAALASRRPGRNSRPWSLPSDAKFLRQPQDGAQERVSRVAAISLRLTGAMLESSLVEPEDARLTGGTRSLMRRLLGLNVTRSLSKSKDRTHLA